MLAARVPRRLPGKTGNPKPEFFDRLHSLPKLHQATGFVDVAICAQFVATGDVLAGLRGGEDDDGDGAEGGFRFKVGKNDAALLTGQVQIPNDGCGPHSPAAGASTPQKGA